MGRGFLIWFLCLSALLAGYLAAQVHPLAFMLFGILAPLPVLVAGQRLGERAALGLALTAGIAIFALHPAWETVWSNLGFFNLLAMGVLLTGLQSRGISASPAIILTAVGLGLIAVLVFLGQAYLQGMAPQDLLAQKSAEVMETVRKVMGETDSLIPGVATGEVETLLRRLLPGLMLINLALMGWLNVVLVRQLAILLGWGVPQPPLYHWAPPEWLIFVVLGAGFILLVPVPGARRVGLNLIIVLAVLYFSQGMAVVASWFQRLGLPRPLRLIGYPLLFLNPFFFLIIALGLVDLWLDFRRLHQPQDA